MTGRLSREASAQIEALFREMGPKLFGRAYTLSNRNRAKAEDLVQAVFEAAVRNWDRSSWPTVSARKCIICRRGPRPG